MINKFMNATGRPLIALILTIIFVFVAFGTAKAETRKASNFALELSDSGWALRDKGLPAFAGSVTSLSGHHGLKILDNMGQPAVANYAGLHEGGVPLATVASAKHLDIVWANYLKNTSIHLYVDGVDQFVNESDANGGIELVTTPGDSFSVLLVRVRQADDDTSDFATIDFTQQTVSVPSSDSQSAATAVVALSALATKTTFRQTTFIPDAYLDAPKSVCTPTTTSSYRFLGDGRTWSSADNASFRTRMDVVVDWLSGPTPVMTRSVGRTVRQVLNSSGTWVDNASDTASNSSMTMSVQSSSASSVVIRLHQDVVNPLCSDLLTNGIYADTLAAIYRNGVVTGSINYLAMPNYELYVRQDALAYSTLARLPYFSPLCLVKGLGGVACTTASSF